VAFKIKKPQLEPKTSGLTFYGVMRLRLLLDDVETPPSPREPSRDSAEPNYQNDSDRFPGPFDPRPKLR
jgi:hypothetical protein